MIPLRFDKDKKIMVEEEWLGHPDPIEKRNQDYEIKNMKGLTVEHIYKYRERLLNPPKYEPATIRVDEEDIPLVNKLAPFLGYGGDFYAALAIMEQKYCLRIGLSDIPIEEYVDMLCK